MGALVAFIKEVAYPRINETLINMDADFDRQKDVKKKRYLETFKAVCKGVKEFTWQTGKEAANVSLSLMRSNLLYGKNIYDVHVYDKGWYMNGYVKTGEVDVSDIYNPLEEIEGYLRMESKKRVGKINPSDIDNIISQSYRSFNQLFIKLFRYQLVDLIESDEYKDIIKADDFRVYTGELYDSPYILYRETKEKMDAEALIARITGGESCAYHDLQGINLTNANLAGADFRFSDFRGSSLQGVNLSSSKLDGVIFKDCRLQGAVFKNTVLNEANFQNADLTGADFSHSFSTEGYCVTDKWDAPCKLPLSLQGADMSGAVMEESVFIGTDFRDVKLDGANFKDSDLLGCKFKEEQLSKINLTAEQRSQIMVGG